MNSRQEPRYKHHPPQHQQQYRPHHHNYGGAVPQQGPPPNVAQNRMPNAAAASMRAQGMNPRPSHGPQQQQQQQQPQQLQNQVQQHGGGVAVQQHQGYSHVSSQGHPPHHPHAMYYTHAQHHHAAPQSYIQIPYAISQATNPGIPLQSISLQPVAYPRFTAYTYGAQPGQAQPAYYHTANTQPQAHQMYTTAVAPQYVHPQHRMNTATMHQNSQAVVNAQQQLQQAPVVTPSHGGVVTTMSAQHQPQQHHPQQPVVQQQSQPIARQEKSHERKKNILPIVDPKTGRHVIDNSPSPAAAPNSATTAESGSAKGASTESAQISLPSSGDKPDSQSQITPQSQEKQDSKPKDEPPAAAKEEGGTTERNKSSAVRAEFFQKIAQASDDTRTSSSTSSGNANASAETVGSSSSNQADVDAEVEEPVVAVATSTPIASPSTPTRDKSPSPEPKQLVVNTPVANTSSDDSKDASLVSISPTPMENYTTPRSRDVISSPSLQPTIEKYAEEAGEEEPLDEEDDGAVPEEFPEPEPEIITEPVKQNDEEEKSTTASESIQEEARADSALSDSVKQEESEKGDDGGLEDLGSVSEENQPNGHLPMEEGELRDDDESTVADSGNDEQEDSTNSVKGKIKYDRNTLLMIGDRGTIDEFKVAERGLPDLAKDNLNNHIKSHSMGKNSPGGPRDYGRGPRGMPNQGNKGPSYGPLPTHPNLRMGGGGIGGMNWGGGIIIPPPPPGRVQPKVQLTLTREEVKLHKAENAWKPGALKRGPNAEPNVDEESIMTDSIVKKTRGILNKLTPDNFDKLVSKFMALPLEDKDERISSVISVVFEKAIDEPSFSTAYARMVHTVCKNSMETSKKFRKQILDQCQREFSKNNTDEAEIKEVEQKLEEATDNESREQLKVLIEEKKTSSRRRSLGNVRFIGELYKLQMLTPKIMVECVNLLLYNPDDENLECLCKLLSTVGQRLDVHIKNIEDSIARGDNKPKFCPEPKWMDKTFSKLQGLSENKKLSSRIRFAILDVVELREHDWKPRRDTNAPKTIEEVRQDAIRQEQEEKRQINSLPPVQNNYGGGGDRDHRSGGGSRPPGTQPQKKGSEWSTLPANKASRFQNSGKKPEPGRSGENQVFGPPSWGSSNSWSNQRNQSGPPSSSQSKQPFLPNLPPRMLTNRFSNLAQDEGSRQPNKSMPNSSEGSNFREPPQQPPLYTPHRAPPSLINASPPPSNNSSAENSRPVTPKEIPETCTADTGESVKNIFQEYLSCKKFDDTLHWIKKRFPGSQINDFVDEMSRQVGELSKEEEQKCAGSLVRLLIKNKEIPKDSVITIMAQGVMQDLPDIMIDSPMATSYLAQFLVEVFSEDQNLDWLVQVGETLIEDSEEEDSAWRLLAVNSLNLLKLRKNEEFVQTSFRQTERKNVIPIDKIPWLQDKPIDTLAEQMVKVLSQKSDSSDQIGQIFQEHSWDVREERTTVALTEAICTLTWDLETRSWNDEKLKKLLPLLQPNKSIFPLVWKQVEEFAKRGSIKKDECEGLWSIMYSLNMTTTPE